MFPPWRKQPTLVEAADADDLDGFLDVEDYLEHIDSARVQRDVQAQAEAEQKRNAESASCDHDAVRPAGIIEPPRRRGLSMDHAVLQTHSQHAAARALPAALAAWMEPLAQLPTGTACGDMAETVQAETRSSADEHGYVSIVAVGPRSNGHEKPGGWSAVEPVASLAASPAAAADCPDGAAYTPYGPDCDMCSICSAESAPGVVVLVDKVDAAKNERAERGSPCRRLVRRRCRCSS